MIEIKFNEINALQYILLKLIIVLYVYIYIYIYKLHENFIKILIKKINMKIYKIYIENIAFVFHDRPIQVQEDRKGLPF